MLNIDDHIALLSAHCNDHTQRAAVAAAPPPRCRKDPPPPPPCLPLLVLLLLVLGLVVVLLLQTMTALVVLLDRPAAMPWPAVCSETKNTDCLHVAIQLQSRQMLLQVC